MDISDESYVEHTGMLKNGRRNADNIHILMKIRSQYAVGNMVGKLIGIGEIYGLKKIFIVGDWKEKVVWSLRFFVTTRAIDEAKIFRCIEWRLSIWITRSSNLN